MYTVKPVGDKFSICADGGDAIPEMMFDTEAEAQAKVDEMNKADEAKTFAVKFIGANRVRGYAAIWGDAEHPDLSNTRDYFTKQTDFWDARLGLPRPLTYHHGFEQNTKTQPVVGMIDKLGQDEIGKWYEAELDKSHKYADAIKKLVERGALKSSSDSVPQYVQREKQANGTNWLKSWALFGVSLTPTPAEPRMYAVHEIKSLFDQIGNALQLPEAQAENADATALKANAANASDDTKTKNTQEVKEMDENQVAQIVAAQLKAADEAKQKDAEAKAAFDAQVKAEAQKLFDAEAKANRPALFNSGNGQRVAVISRYDTMDLKDLALLATLRGEAKTLDENLRKALAFRSMQAIEQGKLEAKTMEGFEVKSNEVMQSTLASYGDEWVPTNFSSQLWTKLREQSRVFGSGFIPEMEVPQGYESLTLPIESADVTFYNVSQVASEDSTMKTPVATITSSKEGTGQQVITLGKIGARVQVSGELAEDSIIPAIPEVRAKLERQLGPELDFLMFNADATAATDNINGNGTPVSGADYTIWSTSFIRNGLKGNTAANASDAGAAITSAKIRTFYNLLGTSGFYVWDDPTQCRVFCDYVAWSKLMGLSDLLTVANAGDTWATIVNGIDPNRGINVHGVKWLPTSGVKAAQATGVRHGTEASNTLGRAVLVRGDQWKLAWKRRAQFETTRIARADMTEIVVTLRFGMNYFDTDASAVLYNI